MGNIGMNNKSPSLDKAVKRAEKGEFREYWLQSYIKDNYKKLGFNSLEGPFKAGYDFKGVYKGKKVAVESERTVKDFVYHGHDLKEVDILIVLNDDCEDVILGMKPTEWKKRLPKKIIKVDPEDFVKATHEMRKDYAIKKQKDRDAFIKLLPFLRIKNAFGKLYDLFVEETEGQKAGRLYGPEAKAFDEALDFTAIEYINTYNFNLEKLRKGSVFTRIETLANDLIKSRREFNDLKSEEKEFLEEWLDILHTEYASRI